MKFPELLQRVCQNRGKEPFKGSLLAIDPGETIGWALFDKGDLIKCGQINEGAHGNMVKIEELITEGVTWHNILPTAPVDWVVYEAYRVYSWKSEQHIWNELYTVRLIGVIEYICTKNEIPFSSQMAGTAKDFCSDDKLKQWGYYIKGRKHSRDAIRHGCYWLLFGKEGM